MNQIIITGNLKDKPEIWEAADTKFARFSIAHNLQRFDGNGVATTDSHRVVIFNDYLADMFVPSLSKGTHVKIEGRLRNKKLVKKDGTQTTITEIVIDNDNGRIEVLN